MPAPKKAAKKSKKVVLEETPQQKEEVVVEKKEPTIAKPKKAAAPSKQKPSFVPKEVMLLEGKECVFVERLRGKVVVRFLEGGYGSAEESKFSVK